MGAIPEKTPRESSGSSKKPIIMIAGILGAIALVGIGYMLWFVSPNQVTEMVKVVAVTESGCIAETMDGFAINIGPCNAQPGERIMATYDAKVKERAAAMNPTK
jgi:flagellar basal body-associated protein FliL